MRNVQFNICFDDGDTWRCHDTVESVTAWRPDPDDRDTGYPLVAGATLGQAVSLIEIIRGKEGK